MVPQIRKLGIGLLVAFVALFLQLNYVQIFAAEDIAGNLANPRELIARFSVKRGDVLTLDGKVVARSEATKGRLKYVRTYPEGELFAPITGFYSWIYGASGIEAAYDDELRGDSGVLTMQDIEDRFLDSGDRGDNVRLTIHSALQKATKAALGDQRGAVVALNPHTGEVRALWSNPSYDPGPLSSHDRDTARSYRQSLDPKSPTSPLVNRATSRSYPPGSTFKVVTTAAALDSGRYGPDSTFEDPVALDLPQTDQDLQNFTRTTCAGGTIDLFTALTVSCDTTYAMLGLELHDQIRTMAEAMGFNEAIPFDIGTAASDFPAVGEDNKPLRAYAGIGQGSVTATPLQMALVAATVANDGVVPRPRLVKQVIDVNGDVVRDSSRETLGRAMSQETAEQVTEMMVSVVEQGTGTAAQIEGVSVAAKTGTAQRTQGENPDVWFIAFAPADNPRLAVAVIVESGGALGSEATGGAVAGPIAKQVLEADRRISNEW